ncbi:MAG: Fic family protein [Gemmatimonadaceae bacterium]|nr:Fic family protein [Gemmatimonadaceae bacterium]
MRDRFDERLREIPAGALHGLLRRLSAIEAFRGRWESAPKPGTRILRRVRESVASRSAAASCRIAGENRPGAALGYADALRTVFEGYSSIPPTEERLLALHAAMFRHLPVERAGAGRYKSAGPRERSDRDFLSEPVALRSPGPLLIPAQMETLSGWLPSRLAGGEFHPLLVVAAYLLEFLAIRPFADGNGRVGRLLTNLLLLRCGHAYLPYGSLDAAIHARRDEYYLSLRRSQLSRNLPRPDISPWLFAFLDALGEMQRREANEVIAGLPGEEALSVNQTAVLEIAVREGEVTNRRAAAKLGLPRETAKQTLNRLVALGALRRLGSGRATRYRPLAGEP